MFSRTVSLGLIAAVIACPLWCCDVLGASQCCATGDSEREMGCSRQLSDCCCGEEEIPPQTPRRDDDQCPCDTAGCQGICGGAVLQESAELNLETSAVLLRVIDAHASESLKLLDCCRHRLEHSPGGCCTNPGRAIRTLYMSFLC